jgi:hypothetical protein
MSGVPFWNHPRFNLVAESLKDRGFDVINPADLDPTWDYNDLIQVGLYDLKWRADGVAVLPRWQRSRGAVQEVKIARDELKIPVHRVFTWLWLGPDRTPVVSRPIRVEKQETPAELRARIAARIASLSDVRIIPTHQKKDD